MKYYLVSTSPRRREILSLVLKDFEIVSPDCNEDISNVENIYEIPKILARRKCSSFKLKDDEIAIGSDTIVVIGNKIYGKPKDKNEAFSMLKSLSGNDHYVVSGICVRSNKKEISDYVVTKVTMREVPDSEILSYINNYNTFDKAGAYAIQEKAGSFISSIEGDYYNIVGFPLCRFCEIMKETSVSKRS